jgi:hypothetical protein
VRQRLFAGRVRYLEFSRANFLFCWIAIFERDVGRWIGPAAAGAMLKKWRRSRVN